MRDVAVNFPDSQDQPAAKAAAEADELTDGARLELHAALPPEAVTLRIYSVQWRMDGTAALMGPFREPLGIRQSNVRPVAVRCRTRAD